MEAHEAEAMIGAARMSDPVANRVSSGAAPAVRSDEATGTGSQIDAFGFDHDAEDHNGQFSLFATAGPTAGAPAGAPEARPERLLPDGLD